MPIVSMATYWLVASIALAKIFREPMAAVTADDRSPLQQWLLRLTTSKPFALMEFSFALGLLPLGSLNSQLFCATILGLFVLTGLVLPRIWNGFECNCFGRLQGKTKKFQTGVQVLILVGVGSIALIAGGGGGGGEGVFTWHGPAWLLAAIVTLPVLLCVCLERAMSDLPLRGGKTGTVHLGLPTDLQLGLTRDGKLTLFADLNVKSGPVVLIGLHSDCQGCSELFPDLARTVKAISQLVPVVVCSNSWVYLDQFLGTKVTTFYDEDNSCIDSVGVLSYPYSILIQAESMEMAPLVAKTFSSMMQILATAVVRARNQNCLT